MDGPSTSSHHTNFGDEFGCVGGDTFGVSVELESCVSTLELVQLQMDKLGELKFSYYLDELRFNNTHQKGLKEAYQSEISSPGFWGDRGMCSCTAWL